MHMPTDSPVPAAHASVQRIRFVLVGTQHPGNIGAAARALKTMGLARLVLVAPEQYPADEAFRRAAGADDLLAQAVVVPTLAEAVSDCRFVLGCTARSAVWPWRNWRRARRRHAWSRRPVQGRWRWCSAVNALA